MIPLWKSVNAFRCFKIWAGMFRSSGRQPIPGSQEETLQHMQPPHRHVGATVLTDNRAVYYALTKGHGRTFSVYEALAVTVLLVNKSYWVGWIPTDDNPADDPSRLHLTISVGAGGAAARGLAPI
ncbi:hypothetical protein HPB47_006612 [Ixodes persulcatus]|uniref:Uncharacterized protein n=1 Tax=Ixodes persulcatus TaxID=34615 RepID=A0AC60PA00_IXOPE|nr:hypothetical protein HPB47_006612 [Ixodes persulcatus]